MRLTQRPAYRWAVLGMGFLGVFGGVGLGRFGYSAILPFMQEGLGISSAAAGALASWNLGGYLPMAAISGVLAYRFGTRLVVGLGSLVAALGMFLTGMASDLALASAARLLTGLGSGAVLVPSVALMSSWFGGHRRGMASGMAASGPALAMVLAGPVVPLVVEGGGAEGWRMAWYLFAGLTCAVGLLTLAIQRNRPPESTMGVTAKPLVVGETQTSNTQAAGSAPRSGFAADLRRVMRSRHAWHLGFVYMTFGFAYMIYLTFFQKRLIVDLGMSSAAAGRLFLMVGALSLVCGLVWGAISDHIGRGKALAANALLQVIASALFALCPSTAGVVVSAVLCGLTAIAVPGIIGASCGDRFGPLLAATSLGFVTLFLGVGQVAGPYLAGWMADVFGSLKYSYLLAAGAFGLGAILAGLLGDARPVRDETWPRVRP